MYLVKRESKPIIYKYGGGYKGVENNEEYLPGWSDSNDHAGWTLRAERDICTPVCRVRLYCHPERVTETAKFLAVRG